MWATLHAKSQSSHYPQGFQSSLDGDLVRSAALSKSESAEEGGCRVMTPHRRRHTLSCVAGRWAARSMVGS